MQTETAVERQCKKLAQRRKPRQNDYNTKEDQEMNVKKWKTDRD